MNDREIQAILDYLRLYPDPPSIDWSQHEFEEVSFSAWATGEILNAIMDHPFVPAKETIENFELKMTFYALASDGHQSSQIFSIAAQTAREFIDLLWKGETNG